MRYALLPLVLASATVLPAQHTHHGAESSSHEAQIVVTINPEARVSAVMGASLPLPASCGSAVALKVMVVNQGFLTARLRAAIVGDSAHDVDVHMEATKLNGRLQDHRELHVVPRHPGPADVTIVFSLDNNIGGNGGRDRVNFLVRCRKEVNSIPATSDNSRRSL